MKSAAPHPADLSLVPLGAGDLIDRAVRFYRKNFWTFVLIASPPVIVGTLISVGWTIIGRQVFSVSTDRYSIETTFYFVFIWFGSIVIWLAETIATLVVMGGASRNFVRHLLFGEAITFRETYKNAWKRLGGLIVASSIITIVLAIIGFVMFYFAAIIIFLLVMLIFAAIGFIPIVAFIVSVVVGLAVAAGAIWVFFLAASRVAYVPQIMLVEGQGIFAAIGRSAGFATLNVLRLAALFFFTTLATLSALAILYIPLALYASASGVDIGNFDADVVPAWYEVAYNLIWQISFILLSPIWTIGLCLLYVDERVRTEGYDIELMAAARLGEIPAVPTTYINPLHPALSDPTNVEGTVRRPERGAITTLGLK